MINSIQPALDCYKPARGPCYGLLQSIKPRGPACWVLDVENFGPFLVESDLAGNSLFERENAKIAPGLAQLYEGTRPATLRRYGETDDKTDEVI